MNHVHSCLKAIIAARYGLMMHYLSEYLTDNVFADAPGDDAGWSPEALASGAERETVRSQPPPRETLALQIPEVIRQWLRLQ